MRNIALMATGCIFLLAGGLFYTIERLTAAVHWFAEVHSGFAPIEPSSLSPFSNIFVWLFLISGIIIFFSGLWKVYDKENLPTPIKESETDKPV